MPKMWFKFNIEQVNEKVDEKKKNHLSINKVKTKVPTDKQTKKKKKLY